ILRTIAKLDRAWPKARLFPLALRATFALRPKLKRFAPMVLHETLGAALPKGAKVAAVLWGACQLFARRHAAAIRRAGIDDRGAGVGEALFDAILKRPSGTLISTHTHDEMWSWIRHDDGKIHLSIPEMLAEIDALPTGASTADDFPLVLLAGERRSFNANTIIREPSWRKQDADGALKVSPADADELGIENGEVMLCESSTGSVRVRIELSDELRPGVVSMPHGYGMVEDETKNGPAVNELTAAEHCDNLAKTPFHKYVPVRLRPAPADRADVAAGG
ncbi:MAG: molybdopterin dinucleotide binding domain-containing protein, partial [Acidobacteriota bacterium]